MGTDIPIPSLPGLSIDCIAESIIKEYLHKKSLINTIKQMDKEARLYNKSALHNHLKMNHKSYYIKHDSLLQLLNLNRQFTEIFNPEETVLGLIMKACNINREEFTIGLQFLDDNSFDETTEGEIESEEQCIREHNYGMNLINTSGTIDVQGDMNDAISDNACDDASNVNDTTVKDPQLSQNISLQKSTISSPSPENKKLSSPVASFHVRNTRNELINVHIDRVKSKSSGKEDDETDKGKTHVNLTLPLDKKGKKSDLVLNSKFKNLKTDLSKLVFEVKTKKTLVSNVANSSVVKTKHKMSSILRRTSKKNPGNSTIDFGSNFNTKGAFPIRTTMNSLQRTKVLRKHHRKIVEETCSDVDAPQIKGDQRIPLHSSKTKSNKTTPTTVDTDRTEMKRILDEPINLVPACYRKTTQVSSKRTMISDSTERSEIQQKQLRITDEPTVMIPASLRKCEFCPVDFSDYRFTEPQLEKMLPTTHDTLVCHINASNDSPFSVTLSVDAKTAAECGTWIAEFHKISMKVISIESGHYKHNEASSNTYHLFRQTRYCDCTTNDGFQIKVSLYLASDLNPYKKFKHGSHPFEVEMTWLPKASPKRAFALNSSSYHGTHQDKSLDKPLNGENVYCSSFNKETKPDLLNMSQAAKSPAVSQPEENSIKTSTSTIPITISTVSTKSPPPNNSTTVTTTADISSTSQLQTASLSNATITEMSSSKTSQDEGKKIFTCAICKEKFICMAFYKKHLFTHQAQKQHKCNICPGLAFFKEEILNEHYEKFHGGCRFSCTKCLKEYKTEYQLEGHTVFCQQNHKSTLCPLCGFLCKDEKRFKMHMRDHRPNFKCEVCCQEFKLLYNLQIHQRKVHSDRSFDQPELPKLETCGQCGRLVKDLKKHIYYVHMYNYKCVTCSKTFKTEKAKSKHLCNPRGVRGKNREKKFPCVICQIKFGSAKTLKMHFKSRHSGMEFINLLE